MFLIIHWKSKVTAKVITDVKLFLIEVHLSEDYFDLKDKGVYW